MYRIKNETYTQSNDIFFHSISIIRILLISVDKLMTPMDLTDGLLNTQLYDKIEECKEFEHIRNNCILEEYKEQTNDCYNILFDFETITTGAKHEPYSCWVYNDEIQQEVVGVDNCAIGMSNGYQQIMIFLLIAHRSDYDVTIDIYIYTCIVFIL